MRYHYTQRMALIYNDNMNILYFLVSPFTYLFLHKIKLYAKFVILFALMQSMFRFQVRINVIYIIPT